LHRNHTTLGIDTLGLCSTAAFFVVTSSKMVIAMPFMMVLMQTVVGGNSDIPASPADHVQVNW